MPEGDSVFRAAAQLHAALAGKELVSTDFRVPRFATLKLGGWTVEEVVPRGKHLLIRVAGPRPVDRLTIHSHLKMEGTWQIYPPGRPLAEARLYRPVRAPHRDAPTPSGSPWDCLKSSPPPKRPVS